MSTVNLTKDSTSTIAPHALVSSHVEVLDFKIEKIQFGYAADVDFGVSMVYTDMGSWSRLSGGEIVAFTRKGLLRKIEAVRKSHAAWYASQVG
jgi:hypothetical protein